MEITVNLQYGPLDVEVHADGDEDYKSELLELLDLIKEHNDLLGEVHSNHGDKQGSEQVEERPEATLTQDWHSGGDGSEELEPLADFVRLPPEALSTIFDIDPMGEEVPVLQLEDVEKLGGKQRDKQRNASLMLLIAWEVCYDEDKVASSDLKDALGFSGIPDENMYNMYQDEGDRYFDRGGRGPTATVALTGPGKREARKVIKKIVEGESLVEDGE